MSNAPVGVILIVALALAGLALVKHEQQTDATYQAAKHEYEQSKQIVPEDAAAHRPYTSDKAYREEWRAEQDLEAQRTMAWWSKIASVATCIGVLLLVATLWETTRTTAVAAEATQAANASLEHAKDTAVRQLRAYLSIESGDLTLHDQTFLAVLTIRNSGQTPAYKLKVKSRIGTQPAGDAFVMPPDDGAVEDSAALLGPGAKIIPRLEFTVPAEYPGVVPAVLEGRATVFFWGRVTYIDAFKMERYLEFRMRGLRITGQNGWNFKPDKEGNDGN